MFVIGATRSRSPPMPVPEPFGQGVGRFSGDVGRERKIGTGKRRQQTPACKHAECIPRRRRGGRLSRGGRAVATRSLSRAVGRLAMTTAERDASTRARASQHRAGLSRTLRLDDSLCNTCRVGYRKCRSAIWFQRATSGSPRFTRTTKSLKKRRCLSNAANQYRGSCRRVPHFRRPLSASAPPQPIAPRVPASESGTQPTRRRHRGESVPQRRTRRDAGAGRRARHGCATSSTKVGGCLSITDLIANVAPGSLFSPLPAMAHRI
jgi:hypothetical protein